MRQVFQDLRSGATTVDEAPAPGPRGNCLLIRTRRTLISAGTERMLVEFGKASLIGKARSQPDKVKQVLEKIKTDGLLPTLEAVFRRLDEPLPLGYCNAGVVLEVGRNVTEFKPGDRVISNGPHSEIVAAAKNLCAKIPDDVDDERAAFTVLGSIALQGIRLAGPTLGEKFVVYGLGLVGLVAVQLLRANGCEVMGVDLNPDRLALARSFGAVGVHACVPNTSRQRVNPACKSASSRRLRVPGGASLGMKSPWHPHASERQTSPRRVFAHVSLASQPPAQGRAHTPGRVGSLRTQRAPPSQCASSAQGVSTPSRAHNSARGS